MKSAVRQRAFTLIELLVVIGLIAVLAGGIGVAMLSGNSDKALQNSQAIIGSMTSLARTKAALAQRDAALAVNVQPGTDGFLREFRVVVRNGAGTAWLAEGESTFLDKGIYFVVPSSAFTTNVDFTGTWANELRSNAFDTGNIDIRRPDDSGDLTADDYRLVKVFNSRGTVVASPAGSRIVLSPASLSSDDKITYDRPEAVRGLQVSNYGIGVLINEAEAFKP